MEKELPKNWIEVELEQIGEDKYYAIGDGDHGQIKPTDYQESGIPYIRVSDIGWGNFKPEKLVYISDEVHKKNLKSELLPGDILIAKTGATIGKCCIVPESISRANTTSSVGKVSINKELTSNKWILYFFLSPEFFKTMWSNSSRTAQPGFNIIHLKKFIIPLPPLSEQNRIVAKLDSLFAQLESIKTSMAKIPVLLKNFRQQVLTQAVTGKLTEEWRNGNDLDDWEEKRIDEMSSSRLGKMLDKAKNIGEEFEYLGNIDVQWNKINVYNLKKVRIEEKEFKKFLLEKGDILVCEGGEAGRAAIWEKEDSKIIYQKALHRIRVHNNYHPKFLLFKLELDTKSGEISKLYTGTTIKHLTGQNLATYTVKYPPFEEQQEIVSRVESLFAKADAIEEKYKNLKAKIETLPQTILHKAFKGELTERLETDGDARVLLEEIAALKNGEKPKKVVSKKYD